MPDGEDARPAGGALRTAWLVGVVAVAGVCGLSAGGAAAEADGSTPLTELDSTSGKRTWLFEPGTFNPLAKLQGGAVWGVLPDHAGSPVELYDGAGSRSYSTVLDLYGESRPVEAGTDCPFRFAGQYADEETGLYYNRFRYYDPAQGGYLTPDPIGLAGGLRAYGYVEDPLGWVDPLGLAKKCGTDPDASGGEATSPPRRSEPSIGPSAAQRS